jgi:hypothetical protein
MAEANGSAGSALGRPIPAWALMREAAKRNGGARRLAAMHLAGPHAADGSPSSGPRRALPRWPRTGGAAVPTRRRRRRRNRGSPRESPGVAVAEALKIWRRGPCRGYPPEHACKLPPDYVAEGVDDGELRLGRSPERTPGTNRGTEDGRDDRRPAVLPWTR